MTPTTPSAVLEAAKARCQRCDGRGWFYYSAKTCWTCLGSGIQPPPRVRCQHGIRWPWTCHDCDEAALAALAAQSASQKENEG